MNEERLRRRLERARAEAQALETLIEERTRSLYLAQASLRDTARFLERLMGSIPTAVIVFDAEGVTRVNSAACHLTGCTEQELLGTPLLELFEWREPRGPMATDLTALSTWKGEAQLKAKGDNPIPVLLATSPLQMGDDGCEAAVCVATDVREKHRMEVELRHAQKLESVGQLAAGVAHEINTPIQFIWDSIEFLGEATGDLFGVLEVYRGMKATAPEEQLRRAEAAELEADLDFLVDELPAAVERAVKGLGRVSTIVTAMKRFSHPGEDVMVPVDLAEILETTLTVARNEYKYTAEIQREFGTLEHVPAKSGDLHQVFINLLVNAAHAIEARYGTGGQLGQIRVSTSQTDAWAEVRIQDDGSGIAEENRARIFDPFFTTKEVGKGSGQGLALARTIVVEGHGGELTFETEPGQGTTFIVRLPRVSGGSASNQGTDGTPFETAA